MDLSKLIGRTNIKHGNFPFNLSPLCGKVQAKVEMEVDLEGGGALGW